jgi:Flp pilus assembly protein TadD
MIRNFRKGVRLAHRAVDIGKNDSEALWMAGLALVQLGGEIVLGLAKIERPLQSIPIRQTPGRQVALRAAYLGDTAAANDHFEKAQRLNPLDVSHHVHWNAVAWDTLGTDRSRTRTTRCGHSACSRPIRKVRE